jgi:membrane protease YdiL (CAAX protease family)
MAARARALTGQYPVVVFFILSYAFSWLAWILGALLWPGGADDLLPSWLGGFGPAIAAILVAILATGKDGLEDLLSRLFIWRVGIVWHLAALFLPLLMVLAAAGLTALLGISTSTDAPDAARVVDVLPELVLASLIGTALGVIVTAGEEIGWRGYALPKLQEKHSALAASLIVGIFWGLWHIPWVFLVYQPEGSYTVVDVLLYGLGFDAAAVMYTWISNHTRGSVLLACVFHSTYDLTAILVAVIVPFSFRIHMGVLVVTAIGIIALAGPKHLSRMPVSEAKEET